MARNNLPLSLIVPTRNRVPSLKRFLTSLVETASDLSFFEVVLVIDRDDTETQLVKDDRLQIQMVCVEPGLRMGQLNAAGFHASTGRFVMLLNDDVIVRTAGWDRSIGKRMQRYADEIVLIHVNDTLMRRNLCTFPIVSRKFAELSGGICPETYIRYRIDDHIEDVFNMLAHCGERRTIYLPDVLFEHTNGVERGEGVVEYHADPATLAQDAPEFLRWLPTRKRLVLQLLECIKGSLAEPEKERWRARLDKISDPFTLRGPERQQVESDDPIVERAMRYLTTRSKQALRLVSRGWKCYREKGCRAVLQAIKRHSRVVLRPQQRTEKDVLPY